MPLAKLILAYFLTMVVFCVLDITWVGFIGKNLYRKHIGHLMSDTVNWPAIIIFYLLYLAGLFVFIILPATEKEALSYAILYGALFGLIAYGTYDLTNLGTLQKWPVVITVVDMVWGAFITGAVSAAGMCLVKWLR